MPKNTYGRSVNCRFDGCKDLGFYRYDTRKEYNDACVENKLWTCCRHSHRLITPSDPKAEWVSKPCDKSAQYPGLGGLWFGSWAAINAEDIRAEAVDFPIGTRREVSKLARAKWVAMRQQVWCACGIASRAKRCPRCSRKRKV